MASSTTRCSPCSERHITKPSAYWCLECEEAICDDCQEHHKVFKATRGHELIPSDNFKSLPSFITDIQQSCLYHNKKYQQYCVAHALPICFKCIKEHQKCNVIPLGEVANNAKTSGQLQDLETRLTDLLQNIDRIQKVRKANLVSIEEMKEIRLAEIQQIRNQINKHLDKLDKEIKQDLEKKECQCKKNIHKILTSVIEKENVIIEHQTNLQSSKQHASGLQTFLGMRDIEHVEVKVFENVQFLLSLI
ncbi:E3 ubiquitin-protein ligase TRIM71-like [Mytilus edulis]|uniref:E3 ubiquitin-protein ligase TRIM71-like n=1 Tax=Mytilus edulis TaxID=6550 RepID=UPI0039EEE52A